MIDEIARALRLFSQTVVDLVAMPLVLGLVGYVLDRRIDSLPAATLGLALVGFCLSIWRMIRKIQN